MTWFKGGVWWGGVGGALLLLVSLAFSLFSLRERESGDDLRMYLWWSCC